MRLLTADIARPANGAIGDHRRICILSAGSSDTLRGSTIRMVPLLDPGIYRSSPVAIDWFYEPYRYAPLGLVPSYTIISTL